MVEHNGLPRLGTRLSISCSLCIVKYIGPLDGTGGTWLGVEWDDPARGKHSGSHDGKAYFTTRVAGAGSFIRPGKKTDGERGFLEALRGKYVSHEGYKRVVLEESGKEVQMIGFDKVEQQQSNLAELAIVVLDAALIRYADPPEEIRMTCPRITSLDLSRNLFSSLQTVAEICAPLTELRTLRLTGNRFREADLNEEGEFERAFERVAWLALNMCALSWEEIEGILRWFTSVKHVEIGFNHLRDPERILRFPSILETLILESNEIMSIDVLNNFSAPNLRKLSLANNRVTHVGTNQYPLTSLNLADTQISSWDFLSKLSVALPNLTTLRIHLEPFTTSHNIASESVGSLIVARFPNLAILNGSKITPLERESSELYYLSKIIAEYPSESEREANHPQYKLLISRHGIPSSTYIRMVSGLTLDLTFVCGEKSVEKQVPSNTRISVLKAMISRSLGISVRKRTIIAIDEFDDAAEGIEIGEGDGAKDIGWFISGRRGTVNIV